MRRTFVIAVVVAMLLCPLVVVCDGSGAEAEELPKAPLRFDEEEIKIYDDFNELKHDGDILEVLDLIRIVPVKENVNVIINGEKTTAINVLYAIPKKYFENEIRIETIITGGTVSFELIDEKHGLEPPNKIENVSLNDEISLPNCVVGASITQWKGINNDVELFYPSGALTVDVNFMKLFPKGSTELTLYGECEYDEYEIILKNYEGAISDNRWLITNNEAHLKYTVDSEDITLPTVGDHWYDFISWVDENGTSQKVVTANLLKNINLYANQKLKEFRVNFYKAYDATEPFDSKKLTKINYQCPSIEDKHFAGWYCRDSDNNEIEFKEGVVLQDNMKVYAKYFASSENTSGDTGFYSFMTNNGIKITDNEAVETVVASTVFVMLALGTFLFVFKRH